MIERELVLPVPSERLWDAITDPEALRLWFGASVEWDLRPGGSARFDGQDGSRRRGLVTEVLPGRRLSFQWWNDDEGPDDGDGASEVTYRLEPDPDSDGTRLVVTERPIETVPVHPDQGEASVAGAGRLDEGARAWTAWDGRLVGLWARSASPAGVRRS